MFTNYLHKTLVRSTISFCKPLDLINVINLYCTGGTQNLQLPTYVLNS